MNLHTYVIATNRGSAPNYDSPFTTLAVCKPRIRRKAEIGDVVLAFTGAGVSPEPHAVCWAGQVTDKLTFHQYWKDPRFATKKPQNSRTPDNIYAPNGEDGELVLVPNSTHGCGNVRTDLGGLYVLILNPAWSFGTLPPVLPERFGLRMVGGRRGERMHKWSDDRWQELRQWLDAQGRVGPRKDGAAGLDRSRSACFRKS